ncbi:PREDICTED: protein ELF4-LIKE 3-like isoform X2 [Lupinus angustifolius]|nr:PREDICTED: protein ELF4-LIKE 3-like isoform X2 [Lupinus angustifolius]
MDETAVKSKPDWLNNRTKASGECTGDVGRGGGDEESDDDEECDGEAWNTLSRNFRQAQSVLDQNRVLIEEVNRNHESKIPDNMAKNVGLIQKINSNISKVLSIYSDLSSSFSNSVSQQRGFAPATAKRKNSDGDGDGNDEDDNKVEDVAEPVSEKSEMVD